MRHVFLLAVLAVLGGCSSSPAAPRQFVVYFKSDSATLTPEAAPVVKQIAAAVEAAHPSRITVEGHADGTTQHDAGLAIERAKAVVAALVAAGIAPREIAIQQVAALTAASGVAGHKVLVQLVP